MSASRLSSRYAKAIIVLAQEQNKLDRIYEDMQFLGSSIKAVRELELVFKSPVINAVKKQKIFNAVFSGKLDKLTDSFIEILIRKGREPYLVDVVKAYTEQYNTLNKITPVKIKSAVALSDKVTEELIAKLKEVASLENTTVEKQIDSDLIGGFVLQYEDKLFDASISNRLQELKLLIDDKEFIKTL
ncbi:MAG: ATP synthase F1 subunit delta [Chitinophagales bacterium]